MSEPERFSAYWPIYDSLADDEEALADFEAHCRREGWAEAVESSGGFCIEMGPELTRQPNPNYGRPEPVTGEPDRIKLFLMARGWAVRVAP